ncbi:MAG TPA: phosphatase PAP2 family protein [Terriglobales bacterium]|nr:phosphatase PAP2 family protein [Terriglobales bacterium]
MRLVMLVAALSLAATEANGAELELRPPLAPESERSVASDWLIGAPPVSPAPHYRLWLPTLLVGTAYLAVAVASDPPRRARWSDENGFDDAIGDGVAGGSRGTRNAASAASDAVLAVAGAGLAADHLIMRRHYAALASLGIDSTWILANQLATEVAKNSAGRARPYVDPCRDDDEYVDECRSGRRDNASFYSGHASLAATFAGLLCARHMHRPERTWLDAAACGGGVGAGIATGLLRIAAEQHHATDVLAAWGSGALFGYALPLVFDYGRAEPQAQVRHELGPLLATRVVGLQYSLSF